MACALLVASAMDSTSMRRLFQSCVPALLISSGVTAIVACSSDPFPARTGCNSVPTTEVRLDAGYPDAAAFVEAGPLPEAGAYLPSEQCRILCYSGFCTLKDNGPPVTVTCIPDCTGRVPAGLVLRSRAVASVAAYFTEMARVEAASVHAFRLLAKDLARLGAPEDLVLAARQAAKDEIRHARVANELARRHGGERSPVVIGHVRPRTLFDMALENEVEGCVAESFGVLVGMHQAERMRDPELRRVMREIADDEATHAALSHRVSAWARSRLDQAACARLDAARSASVLSLAGAAAPTLAPWQEELGLPSAKARAILADAFTRAVLENAA